MPDEPTPTAEPTPEPPLSEGPDQSLPAPEPPPEEKPEPVSNEEAARNYLEQLLHFHMPSHADADRAIAIADFIAENGTMPPADWEQPVKEEPFTGGEVPQPGDSIPPAEAQEAFDKGLKTGSTPAEPKEDVPATP